MFEPHLQNTTMGDHQKEIDEFGNNDDFWLFGYGYTRHMLNLQPTDSDTV